MGSPGHLPSSPLPSPPPLHPVPTVKSERMRERERILGTTELAFPHLPVVRSNVGCPGAVAVGEIHRHGGGSGAAGRRPASTDEHQLGAAGVDSPAAGGDRAESPRGLRREPRASVRAGFSVPVSRFMRALCEHYGAELHNFGPNSNSQAAVFVAICEGYLGIEAHWDLWIHLFRGELFVENVRGSRSGSRALEG